MLLAFGGCTGPQMFIKVDRTSPLGMVKGVESLENLRQGIARARGGGEDAGRAGGGGGGARPHAGTQWEMKVAT